jgi:hypothetical protein
VQAEEAELVERNLEGAIPNQLSRNPQKRKVASYQQLLMRQKSSLEPEGPPTPPPSHMQKLLEKWLETRCQEDGSREFGAKKQQERLEPLSQR